MSAGKRAINVTVEIDKNIKAASIHMHGYCSNRGIF